MLVSYRPLGFTRGARGKGCWELRGSLELGGRRRGIELERADVEAAVEGHRRGLHGVVHLGEVDLAPALGGVGPDVELALRRDLDHRPLGPLEASRVLVPSD